MSNGMRVNRTAELAACGVIAALSVIGGVSSAVRADVTIVSQSTPSTGVARTETAYYKGRKIRVNVSGRETFTIYDGEAGKLYVLNPQQKTYFPLDPSANPSASMMAMLRTTPTVKVTPTGATRTIAGQTAHEYKFEASIDIAMDPRTMAATSGAPAGSGTADTAPKHIGNARIDGDEWVVSVASLPDGGAGTIKAEMQQVTMIVPGAKAVLEKMGSIPGIPLAETLTMTFETSAGPNAGKTRVMKSSSAATSVKEGALADSLFEIPAGYKLQQGGMDGTPTGGQRPGATPPK